MKQWNQRDNESAQAYAAFCLYLKTPPTQRTLDKAYQKHFERKHGQPAGKLKKAPGRWTAWSQKYEWPDRAQAFDADQQRKSLIRIANRRQKDVEAFVSADMNISLGVQRIVSKKIAVMMKVDPDDVDSNELRQITMSYDHARTWISELIGLLDNEAQPLSQLALSDEALASRMENADENI